MVETIMIQCMVIKLTIFSLSCHPGSTKWQGERIQGKNGEQFFFTLAIILRLYKPSIIARNGLCQYLARWGKINKLKCFIVSQKIKLQPHNNDTSGGTMPTFLAKVGVIKIIKRLESKKNLNNGTSGGTMPTVLAKVGVKGKNKK
jgi:hypothetical protein